MLRHLFVLAIILPSLVNAQNSDCETAIELGEMTSHAALNVSGAGDKLEISGNELGNKYLFTEEHHTIWYRFTAPYDAKLNFSIVPGDPEDDWDFLLFETDEDKGCEMIVSRQLKPVRSNLARNDIANKSITGLSPTANNEFVAAGPNSNYSKTLEVKKGMNFLLVVDNNKQAGKRHQLSLNYEKVSSTPPVKAPDTTKKITPIRELADWVKEKPVVPKTNYQLNFFDNSSKQPLPCMIKVIFESKGFGQDSTALFENKKEIAFSVDNSTNFSVNISKSGYMFQSKNYRSFRMDTSLTEDFYIPKAKEGEMISLPDINFKENTTHLLTNSINALQQIHDFLVENPNAVIEIRGHVNAPGYDNSGRVKKFSEKRADEVKKFLVGMGIEAKRLKTVGLGNEFMIYPSPVDYQQEKDNRRVEILILEN